MVRTVVAAACAALIAATAASAQTYPSKPVHIVVPFAPGGATDVLGRLVFDRVGTRVGQQIVIDNKPGAGGNIAATYVAKAAPDGYTLLMANHPGHTTAHALAKDPGFDPVKDFVPVGLLATQTMLLNLHPSLPPEDAKAFVAYAKAQPGKLSYATPGIGTPHHLAMEMLKQMAGIDLVHVPYRGGAPAMQDVVAGQVPVMFASYVIAGQHLQAGKLKAIAGSGAERTTQMPNVPTLAEQGYPGFDVTSWFGVIAPTGTPAAAAARLNAEINAVVAMPEVKEQLLKIGFDPAPALSPAQFGALLQNDVDKWGKVVRDAKITAE